MSKGKRAAALLLAALLCLSLPAPALAEGGVHYYVGSAEELAALAEKCALDSWSRGVTVVLTADIDLAGAAFAPIPTFGGTFDGAGHSIRGLSLTASGSHVGLFRYIQETGVVQDLAVLGTVAPGGSAEYVGGIAGNNAGTIRDCSFSGRAEGLVAVGGIAGANEPTGTVEGCYVAGYVGGEHYTGGVVGQNLGVVSGCENTAAVNTSGTEASFELEDLDLDQLNSTENLPDYTDTGGIAGYSSGILAGCVNTGEVGYAHVGYNVGGVAGRQSGYMRDCVNTGAVSGRKEVGGVVGQMEPFLTLDPAAATTENLRVALRRLHELLDQTLVDAQGASDAVTARLGAVSGSMGDAAEDLEYLAGQTVDFVDGTMGAVGDIADRVDYALDSLPELLAYLESASRSLGLAFDDLERVNDDLAIFTQMEAGTYAETDYRLFSLTAGTGGRLTADAASPAAGQVVTVTPRAEAGYALAAIEAVDADGAGLPLTANADGSYSFVMPTLSGDPVGDPVNARAKNTVVRAAFAPAEDYAHALVLSSGWGGTLAADAPDAAAGVAVTITVEPEEGYVLEALEAAVQRADGTREAVPLTRGDDLGTRYSLTMPALGEGERLYVTGAFARRSHMEVVREAADTMDKRAAALSLSMASAQARVDTLRALLDVPGVDTGAVLDALTGLAGDLADAGGALADVVGAGSTILQITAPYVSEAAQRLHTDLGAALAHLQDGSNSLADALACTRRTADYISGLPDVSFPQLGSEYRRRVEDLCGSLGDMADGLSALSGELANAGSLLVSDLRAVNDQFQVVALLLVDALGGISNAGLEDMFTDVSDEEGGGTDGKVAACANRGRVYGDLNVGGVAGAMAIEYDFDPESDVTGASGIQSYLSKCVLADSVNHGEVVAKKDGAGGVVGHMDLGSVTGCLGLGAVSSESGDYVGGIAGRSLTVIRGCWALCTLAGDDRVGGIAGSGTRIYDCRSLAEIEAADECAGAIAGALEEGADLLGNLFASDTLQGVDGISYAGAAEPVAFARLAALDDAPRELDTLALTFVAEGRVVAVLPFVYGGAVDAADIPEVPVKPGYSGAWDAFDPARLTLSRTVEARYVAYGTALESAALLRGDGSPVLLVEGSFLPEARLAARQAGDGAGPEVSGGLLPLETLAVEVAGAADAGAARRVRYYLPETARALSRVALYVNDDGQWRRAAYETVGRYAVFEVSGEGFLLFAAEQPPSSAVWLLAGGGALLVLALLLALRAAKKRRKRAREAPAGAGAAKGA